MATSDTLANVVGLISQLERNGGVVKALSVNDTDEMTGDIRVGFPVLEETTVTEDIEVEIRDVRFDDGNVDLGLHVSTTATDQDRTAVDRPDESTVIDETADVSAERPSYKDPRELENVYEEFETFPEMTAALGVDVTPETVRRYMVEYGIHDPTASSSSRKLLVSDADTSASSTSSKPDADDRSTDDAETSPLETTSVAKRLEQGTIDEATPLVADGSGIPRSLTITDLADVLERSRTISEAQRSLELDYEQTKRFLEKLELVEFVTGRLAASHSEVPPKLVAQRLDDYATE